MFSATESVVRMDCSWKTMAIPWSNASRGPAIGVARPLTRISPSSTVYTPFSTLSRVDFPAPFSPMSPTTSFFPISRDTSSSALTPGNDFVAWRTSRTAVIGALSLHYG